MSIDTRIDLMNKLREIDAKICDLKAEKNVIQAKVLRLGKGAHDENNQA